MGHRNAKIGAYIDSAAPFAQPVLNYLRKLVHDTCPDVEEAWKWSFPNFIYKGAILCSMAAFKSHCSFGFWKAALMENDENILSVTDRVSMGHLGKITSLKDLPKDAVLKKYIKAAMKLNDDGVKAPPKPKSTEKKEIATPDYFAAALKEQPDAETIFDAFAYTHRKEYIDWITEAKSETTRNKRMAQAIEWLQEGKKRNWKYENC